MRLIAAALALLFVLPAAALAQELPTLTQAKLALLAHNPEVVAVRARFETRLPGRGERIAEALSLRLSASYRLGERGRDSLADGTEVYVIGDRTYLDQSYVGLSASVDLGKLTAAAIGRPPGEVRRELRQAEAELAHLVAQKTAALEVLYAERQGLMAAAEAERAAYCAAAVEQAAFELAANDAGRVAQMAAAASLARARASLIAKESALAGNTLAVFHLLGQEGEFAERAGQSATAAESDCGIYRDIEIMTETAPARARRRN